VSSLGLTAAGIGVGLVDIVKKSLEAASAIGDVAKQAGVGVEFLQNFALPPPSQGHRSTLRMKRSSPSTKPLASSSIQGRERAPPPFKKLGIDNLINAGDVRNAEQLFDVLVRKINGFGSEAQKVCISGQRVRQGSRAQNAPAGRAGHGRHREIGSTGRKPRHRPVRKTVEGATEANNKLSALFNVIKAEGISAVASLAPEIAHLAQEITNGLPGLIDWVERWAAWFGLLNLSPVQKLKGQIKDVQDQLTSADSLKQSWWTNPFGIMSLNISQKKAQLVAQLRGLQADLAKASSQAAPGAPAARTTSDPRLHVALTPEQIAAAKKAKELAEHRADLLAQTGADAKTAAAALVVAQDQTQVALLKGSAEYYSAVKKQIDDEYQVKADTAEAEAAKQKIALGKQGKDWKGYAEAVANINQGMNDKIAAADEERKKKQFESGPGALIQNAIEQARVQIQQFDDETASVGLAAGAYAKLVYEQQQLADARAKQIPITKELIDKINEEGNAVGRAAQASHDAIQAKENDIEVSDRLRQGLEDIGVAGLHGFSSMKDAAAQFLQQLADMIIQLYVMKPLVESLLGPSGTGGAGGIIGSLFGFADGGVMTPNGPRQLQRFAGGGTSRKAAIFGEAGPEAAVPLPDGRRIPVDLRMPAIPDISAGGRSGSVIIQNFDLSGAVLTDDLMDRIDRKADAKAKENLARYDRNVLPQRVSTLSNDPRRRY
jgi:hypothetical protein